MLFADQQPSVKSLEVLTKTTDLLRRHGFEEESSRLAGKQTAPHPLTIGLYYSNWRSKWSLDAYLAEHDIIGIQGISSVKH